MNVRFYAPDAHAPGDIVGLPAEEAEHLLRVLRLKAGDSVRVFNGHGGEFDAIVEQTGKSGARVRVRAARSPAAEPRVAVTLAQAVLKGDKMDDLVRDAVMMGVAAIQPFVSGRTEVSPASLARGRRRDRWARIAISSAKQCGRATVPPIREPIEFGELAEALAAIALPQPALMLVEPGAGEGALTLSDVDGSAPREATVVIGPEGGWTPGEIDRAASVCRLVTLGGRTLRADVTAVIALSALFAIWREF